MCVGATAGSPRVPDADQFRAGARELRKQNCRRPQGATHLDQEPARLASAADKLPANDRGHTGGERFTAFGAGRARALIGVSQWVNPRADPMTTSLKTAAKIRRASG